MSPKLEPIEGALYSCLVETREAQRRCREAGREDLVTQLEHIRQLFLEMRARTNGI